MNKAVSIRGGGTNSVVIMIDGIVVSNPSQITDFYDLRLLAKENIESIEIIKGASSTIVQI